MKKKLFLHIGTFKTGTSAIQRFLCANSSVLEDKGFFVPKGNLIGHHDLPISLIKEHTSWRESWPAFQGASADLWEAVLKQIEGSSCPNVIISSENFCDLVNENARGASKKMGAMLQKYFSSYDVFVVAYLRPLDAYFDSMYREIIKVSPVKVSKSAALQAAIRSNSIHVRPSVVLDYFSELFGRERVQVRRYDLSSFPGGDVVGDMLEWFGIQLERSAVTRSVNPSLKGAAVNLKRIFNLAGIEGFQFNQRISGLLQELTGILDERVASSDYAVISQTMKNEADHLLKTYGVDVRHRDGIEGGGEHWSEVSEGDSVVSLTDGFVIALLATTIRQNRGLLARLENLEKRLSDLYEPE